MSDILHPAVLQILQRYNLTYTAIPCDPALADTAAFCEHYGYSPGQSANTIVVASRADPPAYVACLVLASTKLDVNKKVRQLMGIRKLSFASGEQTVALTGMEIGGVTLPGLPDIPLYVDAAVMQQPEIVIGGGNRSSKLVLDPQELTKLPKLQIIEDLALSRD